MQITTASVEFTRNMKVADYEHSKFTAALSAELEPNDTPAETLAALNYYVQAQVWTALGHPEKAPQAPADPEQTGATAALETRTAGHHEDTQPVEDCGQGTCSPQASPLDQVAAQEQPAEAEPEYTDNPHTDEQIINLASRAAEKAGVKAVQEIAAEFGVKRLQELDGASRAKAADKLEAMT